MWLKRIMELCLSTFIIQSKSTWIYIRICLHVKKGLFTSDKNHGQHHARAVLAFNKITDFFVDNIIIKVDNYNNNNSDNQQGFSFKLKKYRFVLFDSPSGFAMRIKTYFFRIDKHFNHPLCTEPKKLIIIKKLVSFFNKDKFALLFFVISSFRDLYLLCLDRR